VTAHTSYVSGHHKRIDGRSAADHLAAITQYREAVADLLWWLPRRDIPIEPNTWSSLDDT